MEETSERRINSRPVTPRQSSGNVGLHAKATVSTSQKVVPPEMVIKKPLIRGSGRLRPATAHNLSTNPGMHRSSTSPGFSYTRSKARNGINGNNQNGKQATKANEANAIDEMDEDREKNQNKLKDVCHDGDGGSGEEAEAKGSESAQRPQTASARVNYEREEVPRGIKIQFRRKSVAARIITNLFK